MKTPKWSTMSSNPNEIPILLKRQPKLFHKIHFSPSDIHKHKIFSKIRALKIVKSLTISDYEPNDKPLVLSAFKSQRKCLTELNIKDPGLLKHFPRISNYVLCSKMLDSWRVFLQLNHLKTLTLDCPYIKNTMHLGMKKKVGEIRSFYWRFWQHLARQRFLKNFHIHIFNKIEKEMLGFLRRLDNVKLALESFTLFLSHLDLEADVDLGLENVYKELTCFKIHESSFITMQKFLKYLGKFERLESLDILKNLLHAEDGRQLADFGYLSSFAQLNQIKNVEILINFGSGQNFLNFLEHFSLPESILSLKLSFYEADWINLFPDHKYQLLNLKDLNAFEHNSLYLEQFYSKWESLKNLKSLALCFCEKTSSMTPSLYFTTPILKRLTALKSFYFGNWLSHFNNAPAQPEKIKALDLHYLWEALKHMKGSLKKLTVDSSAISLRKFSGDNEERFSLEELGLCGLVVGDIYLENLSKTLDRTASSSLMEVESVIVDNKGTMQRLMEILMGVSKRAQVAVTIDVRNINSEDFMLVVTESLVKIKNKSNIKIGFNKIPELSPLQVKLFQKIYHEYQISISSEKMGKVTNENKKREIYPSSEEIFFGADLDSQSSSEEDSEEEEIEEMSEEDIDEEFLLDDGLEEIDEDI